MSRNQLVPQERIELAILLIRGEKVLLDGDLARLFGVETRVLLQAVRRNQSRFPADFLFQLDPSEAANLRSQFVTSSWGGRRTRPWAFTEHGVAMLATVLRSQRAVAVSIEIIRAFVRMRRFLASHAALARRVAALEKSSAAQGSRIRAVFEALRTHTDSPTPADPRRRVGFRSIPSGPGSLKTRTRRASSGPHRTRGARRGQRAGPPTLTSRRGPRTSA